MIRRAFFVINPVAGSGRAAVAWQSCSSSLSKGGTRPDFALTHGPGEARELARRAAPDYAVVVAVGGDGTVSEVADGILSAANGGTALAVIPAGTGNDFAETLGTVDLQTAQEALRNGVIRTVDVIAVDCRLAGNANQRHALLFASVGIAGECLKKTTPRVKRWFGQRLAYQVGLLRALWSYRARPMRVSVDGRVFEQPFLFAGSSNSERAGGGLKLAPGARIDDGVLNVNLVEALGRWEAFGQVRRLAQGTHVGHPRVRYSTARTMAIEAAEPLEIAADGELIGETPARFSVRPAVLQVLSLPRRSSHSD